MPQVQLPIASYAEASVAPQRLVNVYAEQTPGKQPVALQGAPGIAPLTPLGVGPGRGLFVMRGSLYAVSGTNLYRVSDTGATTLQGTLPGSSKLMFAGNGQDIVFDNGWYYSAGATALISDPDFPAVSAVDFIDGYVVYTQTGTQTWGCSALYDATDYSALDISTAERAPDDLVTLKVDHRQVVLFGQTTTELWWNAAAAGAGFPFELISGGVIEYGIMGRHAVAKQDNSLLWLAHDRTIRRLQGVTPLRVSQHAVERKLSSYARVDDCEAFPLNWNGHLMVVFRFPTAGATWVFDVTTGEWHERATYGFNHWDVVDTAECYGKVFVQQASTGAIGYLSDSVNSEFGTTRRWEWTYPQVYSENRMQRFARLEVVAAAGGAPLGVAPMMGLDISNDGGNTWQTLPPRAMGLTGDYDHVIRWNRLGRSRDRVFRCFVDSAATPIRITDTQLVYE
jgi:hypothetical protein